MLLKLQEIKQNIFITEITDFIFLNIKKKQD